MHANTCAINENRETSTLGIARKCQNFIIKRLYFNWIHNDIIYNPNSWSYSSGFQTCESLESRFMLRQMCSNKVREQIPFEREALIEKNWWKFGDDEWPHESTSSRCTHSWDGKSCIYSIIWSNRSPSSASFYFPILCRGMKITRSVTHSVIFMQEAHCASPYTRSINTPSELYVISSVAQKSRNFFLKPRYTLPMCKVQLAISIRPSENTPTWCRERRWFNSSNNSLE